MLHVSRLISAKILDLDSSHSKAICHYQTNCFFSNLWLRAFLRLEFSLFPRLYLMWRKKSKESWGFTTYFGARFIYFKKLSLKQVSVLEVTFACKELPKLSSLKGWKVSFHECCLAWHYSNTTTVLKHKTCHPPSFETEPSQFCVVLLLSSIFLFELSWNQIIRMNILYWFQNIMSKRKPEKEERSKASLLLSEIEKKSALQQIKWTWPVLPFLYH